ncbi:MAG TPA: alpha/beta fold hydrolase [Natronosporangium sp.]
MATTQFLVRDGGRIAYDDTGGSGPLVLLAPGMGDVRGVYRFIVPKLAEAGYRVVTMDIRGHGESSVGWPDYTPRTSGEDMLALVRELGAGPAVLVGESFTPASAIWAAAEAPELVAGIVLCAPFASTPKPNPILRAAAAVVTRVPAFWARFYRSLYPVAPPPDFPAYLAALRANLAEPGRMAAMRAMAASSKDQCNDRIVDVRCPVLIVMGTQDPDFKDPAAEARLIADRAADATVVMVAAGHYPPAEAPGATAAAMLEFLGRVAPLDRVGDNAG